MPKASSQAAKDKAAQVEQEASQTAEQVAPEEDLAAERRTAARIAARVPDEELGDLEDLELLEEARRRGVTFTRSVTRSQIIAAAKAATAE